MGTCPCTVALGTCPCTGALGTCPCTDALGTCPCTGTLGTCPCTGALGTCPCTGALGTCPCTGALGTCPCTGYVSMHGSQGNVQGSVIPCDVGYMFSHLRNFVFCSFHAAQCSRWQSEPAASTFWVPHCNGSHWPRGYPSRYVFLMYRGQSP